MPIRWSAPESLTKRKFSEKSDIHSLAIVFFEIISDGQIPYFEYDNVKAAQAVTDGKFPKKPNKADETLYELAKSIINLDPQKRPSLDEIIAKFEKINLKETQDNVFSSFYKEEQYQVTPTITPTATLDESDDEEKKEKSTPKNKSKKDNDDEEKKRNSSCKH